jgi:hypothetical protein
MLIKVANALPKGKCERCWALPSEYLSQPRFFAANLGNLLGDIYIAIIFCMFPTKMPKWEQH